MLKYMSDEREEDTTRNFDNEVRFYIDPRGIEYPPISGTPAYTEVIAGDPATGSYSLSQGNLVYALPYSDPMTVQALIKPAFAYNVAGDQSIIKWYSGAEYLELAYIAASDRFAVRNSAGATATILFGPTFTENAQLQAWQRLSFVISGNDISCYSRNVETTGMLTLSTRLNYQLMNIGGNSAGLVNYVRIFPGYAATDQDILGGFAGVKNEEVFFQFNKTAIGKTRCNINTTGDRSVTSYGIERSTGYKAATAYASINNLSGQFSDDQYAAYIPSAGAYNGTTEQRYLTGSVGLQLEAKSLQKADTIPSGLVGYWSMDSLPEYPDNAGGTSWIKNGNFTSGLIEPGATNSPGIGLYGYHNGTAFENTRLSISGGVLVIDKNTANCILRLVIDSRSKTRRIKIKCPSSSSDVSFNNDGTVYFKSVVANEWTTIDVSFNGTGNVFTDIEALPTGISYLSMDYIGDGTYSTLLADNSGNGNHGTIYGATPVAGVSGKALSFDGVNDQVTATPLLGSPTEYSVSLWVNPLNSTNARAVFLIGLLSSNGTALAAGAGSISYYLYVYRSGAQEQLGPFTISNSAYSHLAIVLNVTTKAYVIYVNGSVAISGYASNSFVTPQNNIVLGYGNYSTQYFPGIIDEPRIYNRALSAGEVATLYSMRSGLYAITSDPDFDQLFMGEIPPGSFSRSTLNGGLSTLSISAEDGIAEIARRIVRKSRHWASYYLSRAAPAGNSVFHEIAYLATKREVYNYITNASFENATIADSWGTTGTLARDTTQVLSGTYCGKFTGTDKALSQTVLFKDLTANEQFTASIFVYSASAIAGTLKIYDNHSGGSNGNTSAAWTHSGKGWDRLTVSHTVVSGGTASDRLKVELNFTGAVTNVPVDCAMLKYGGDAPWWVPNDKSGTVYSASGIAQIGSEDLGSYDWVGIDADDVSYVHPWAWINQDENVWENMKEIGDACAAHLMAVDASGVLRFRSTFGSSRGSSLGDISGIASIASGQQSIQANKIIVKGSSIIPRSNIQCVWQAKAAGLESDAGTESGEFVRAVASGGTIPSDAIDGATELEAVYGTIIDKTAVV